MRMYKIGAAFKRSEKSMALSVLDLHTLISAKYWSSAPKWKGQTPVRDLAGLAERLGLIPTK